MERHTIAEMKEILDAIEQGKTVQWYDKDTNTWRDFDSNHGDPYCADYDEIWDEGELKEELAQDEDNIEEDA